MPDGRGEGDERSMFAEELIARSRCGTPRTAQARC